MSRYLVRLAYPGTTPPKWDFQTYVHTKSAEQALERAYQLWRRNGKVPELDRCRHSVQEVNRVRGGAELPCRQAYIEQVENKCASLPASKLDGKFRMVNYPAGFHYGITYGPDAYYNTATLSDLDTMVVENSAAGLLTMGDGNFSTLYSQILDTTGYAYSKSDQKILDDENTAAESQIGTVITEFKNAHGTYTDPLPMGGKIADIISQMYKAYGSIEAMPSSLSALRNAIMSYEQKAKQSSVMLDRWYHAQARLDNAKENAKSPGKVNGGQQTADKTFYVGYSPEKLPTANQMIDSLNTDANNIAISISLEHFDSSETKLTIENKASFVIPIAGVIDIEVEHSSTYSLSKYVSHESTVDISIEYPGIMLVPGIPSNLSADAATGWYDATIIEQIAKNTGNDATGMRLLGSEFSVDELFGEGKRFARLKTFVVSRQPTIRMTMRKVDVASVIEDFQMNNKVSVTLFDFIPIGSHEHNYSVHNVTQDTSTQTVSISFGPPEVSGSTPLEQQIACLVGGVPVYPPYQS
jgi:hypothetical protein